MAVEVTKLPTGRALSPTPTPADRDELLRLWDALSDDGKKVVLYTAAVCARDEGLPEGDGPLVRTGKKMQSKEGRS